MKRKWKSLLKKLWRRFKEYLRKNPAVAYGWVTVITTYIVKKFPTLPNELVVVTILSLLGLSKQVQNLEDKKTLQAIHDILDKENNGKAPR